jgi:hypothetical protein
MELAMCVSISGSENGGFASGIWKEKEKQVLSLQFFSSFIITSSDIV